MEQIKKEIKHIFESGANEIRIENLILNILSKEKLKLKIIAENMYYKGYNDKEMNIKPDFENKFKEVSDLLS